MSVLHDNVPFSNGYIILLLYGAKNKHDLLLHEAQSSTTWGTGISPVRAALSAFKHAHDVATFATVRASVVRFVTALCTTYGQCAHTTGTASPDLAVNGHAARTRPTSHVPTIPRCPLHCLTCPSVLSVPAAPGLALLVLPEARSRYRRCVPTGRRASPRRSHGR